MLVLGDLCQTKDIELAITSASFAELNSHILIDLTHIKTLNGPSIQYLNTFAIDHKAKHLLILAVGKLKTSKFTDIEIIPTVKEARDYLFMEITEQELAKFESDNDI